MLTAQRILLKCVWNVGGYTNKKMAAASSCQLQNNTMIQTRCYPSSMLCIRLWAEPNIVGPQDSNSMRVCVGGK